MVLPEEAAHQIVGLILQAGMAELTQAAEEAAVHTTTLITKAATAARVL